MSGRSVFANISKVLLLCLAVVPLCAAKDWRYEETRSDSREFVSGGYLHVRMTVGDLHIKRSDSTTIRLQYTVKAQHERSVKEARVDFDVHGKDASIEFHSPNSGNTNLDVELDIPINTNIDVHQKVGDMTVEDIVGDKDLNLGVGDLRISTGRAGYSLVNASTGIGDVNSNGYGNTSGWLGKTLKYHGDGKYQLRAHVGVGDIKLQDD
jgi:hypothetical protein